MGNIEKRYQKQGRMKPSLIKRDDIVALAAIIQAGFSKPEI